MKHIYKALLALLLPLNLLAQDTTAVKQQAEMLEQAVISGDYKTVVDHTYPGVIDIVGGKDKMLSSTTDAMNNLKTQGITIEKATIGSPGKFYTAGTEIHCLVPETMRLKLPNGHATVHSSILAVSADGGKTWSYMDINANSKDLIPKLFPHFNPDLKIPDPTPPVMEP
ncbi:MAG TPA: hypothetical protein VFE53_24300 [Mucilaginibacter sp.]|jgi:hypothetical protein|nr:hypothetical protein [Mucilaginibacter sp.]